MQVTHSFQILLICGRIGARVLRGTCIRSIYSKQLGQLHHRTVFQRGIISVAFRNYSRPDLPEVAGINQIHRQPDPFVFPLHATGDHQVDSQLFDRIARLSHLPLPHFAGRHHPQYFSGRVQIGEPAGQRFQQAVAGHAVGWVVANIYERKYREVLGTGLPAKARSLASGTNRWRPRLTRQRWPSLPTIF